MKTTAILKDSAQSYKFIAKTLQMLCYVPIRLYLLLTGSKVRSGFKHEENTGYVLASNHVSKFDPYVITAALGMNVFKMTPFRYIAANKYLDIWFYKIIMYPFGSFPAKPHPKYTSGIEAGSAIVKDGQTLVIFPEGKMVKNRADSQPRRGVVAFASLPGTRLIPVFLHKKRFGYTIVVGESCTVTSESPEQIMDKIYGLGDKIQA